MNSLLFSCLSAAFLFSVINSSAQDTLAFQGFESANHNWTISSGANASNADDSGDTPSGQRRKSGSYSHFTSNATNTLILNGYSDAAHTSRYVEIWVSSTAGTSSNGADGADYIKVFVNNSNSFSATADIQINGNSNVRHGMDGTGVMELTAGADSVYSYPSGGTKSGADALSLIKINIPDAWTEVHLKIETSNNSSNEMWNVDDIRLIGTNSCSAPNTRPSSFSTSSISASGMTLNWTRGNGDSILVLAREGSEIDTDPIKGTSYTADADFSGSGSSLGGAKAVYKGTGTSVALTGLSGGSTYYYALYEYNGTGTCYFSTQLTGNGATTCSTPVDVSSLSASRTYSTVELSWTNSSCYDEVLIVAKETSSISGTPSGDGSAYTADASLSGSGTAFDGGKVVYKGSGTSVSVTNPTEGTTYYYKAFTRKSTSWSSGTEISASFDRIPKLIISEVADPSNLTTARYAELFNADSFALDFSSHTYYFCRQVNGGTFTCKQLSGTLNPGDLYSIANNSSTFSSTYSATADDTWGNTSGNGDDGYFLYYGGDNSSGMLVDAYGVVDEDGSSKSWEYTDSRALRDSTAQDPEPTWNASSWTISSATTTDFTAAFHRSAFPQITLVSTKNVGTGIYRTVTINGSGQTITLTGDVTVLNKLKLKNGYVNLNGNKATLGDSNNDCEVSDYSSSSFVYGGTIRMMVNNASGTYVFPYGTAANSSSYSRSEVTFGGVTLADEAYLESTVTEGKHPNFDAGVTNYINRYYDAEPTGITNISYDMALYYQDADINGSESTILPVKYNSGTWTAPNAGADRGAVDTNGTGSVDVANNKLQWSTLNSFSIFSGAGNGTPLPVNLLYFKGSSSPEGNLLSWSTSSEINSSHFELERRTNDRFETIAWLPAAGNSNEELNYSWLDNTATDADCYYRLRQIDFDGQETVFEVVHLSANSSPDEIRVWSSSSLLQISSNASEAMNYIIITSTGKQAMIGSIQGLQNSIDISDLAVGVYLVELSNADGVIIHRSKVYR